jgi:[ribosomal protein S5]-alanine N-acetyltransferase
MNIPVLETSRLILRAFEPEDVPVLHRIMNGPDVLRYFPPGGPPSYERVERGVTRFLQHWQTRGYGLWAVVEHASGALIGRSGLAFVEELQAVEIDFLFGNLYWGKGYASEAGRAVLDWGLAQHVFERLIGIVHPENTASRRVLEKLGLACQERREMWGMECLIYVLDSPAEPPTPA